MNILIFSSYFLPHKGGVESYVYQTARRLVKRGHKVWVLTSRLSGMKKEERIEGICVIRVPAIDVLPDRLPLQLPLMADIRKIGKIDAIITHTRFYPLSFVGGMYAHLNNIPWLHIEHGAKQVRYDNPLVRLGSQFVDATTGRWILRHAKVAGVSKASCNFTKKLGARKCEVLYNGIDTKFFNGRGKKHKGISVVFVGRLIREKGVQDLLSAAKGMKVKVIIVGKGPAEQELRKLGGTFVGEKSHQQLREILSSSDILVNPSYGEGLPSAVLEAGAMGLAVVATDVGGTREIIVDGKNGYLIKPGDVKTLRAKIDMLVKDAKLRSRFGAALQKTVRDKFNWDKIVDKVEKVLKTL